MKVVTLKLTTKELELLATLVADQLFRKEFIDPKMPGYKSNAEEMSLGKTLIGRLRFMLDPVPVKRTTSPGINGATNRVARVRRVG
jgi:hypothetical protein